MVYSANPYFPQVIPALAAGNCVVVSPASPLPALVFASLCVTAGLPSGVLSVVIGQDARQVTFVTQYSGVIFVT